MSLTLSPELEGFRQEAAQWLEEQLSGPFRHLRGLPSVFPHSTADAMPASANR